MAKTVIGSHRCNNITLMTRIITINWSLHDSYFLPLAWLSAVPLFLCDMYHVTSMNIVCITCLPSLTSLLSNNMNADNHLVCWHTYYDYNDNWVSLLKCCIVLFIHIKRGYEANATKINLSEIIKWKFCSVYFLVLICRHQHAHHDCEQLYFIQTKCNELRVSAYTKVSKPYRDSPTLYGNRLLTTSGKFHFDYQSNHCQGYWLAGFQFVGLCV